MSDQLKQERDHFHQEAGRLLALCEELRAALGEACAIGDQLCYRLDPQRPHPRLNELRALHLPAQPPLGTSIADRLAWIREQMINAQQIQARAYQIVDGLRDTQTELERQQKGSW